MTFPEKERLAVIFEGKVHHVRAILLPNKRCIAHQVFSEAACKAYCVAIV